MKIIDFMSKETLWQLKGERQFGSVVRGEF